MTTEFTYAIQPSYLLELTDHCYVASPNMESAKGIALRQAQDDAIEAARLAREQRSREEAAKKKFAAEHKARSLEIVRRSRPLLQASAESHADHQALQRVILAQAGEVDAELIYVCMYV